MNPKDIMTPLFEPLGDYAPKAHALIVDYTTENGEDRHGEFFPMVPPGMDVEEAAQLIIQEMARCRCTVTSVVELLDGYTQADAERANAAELAKRVRLIYRRPNTPQVE